MNQQNANSLRRLCEGGLIAALYIALTVPLQPIAFGPLQVRPSEMLTILPVLTPAAIPGLAVGCVLSNALCIASNPAGAWDILFGSAATLAAAQTDAGAAPRLSARLAGDVRPAAYSDQRRCCRT